MQRVSDCPFYLPIRTTKSRHGVTSSWDCISASSFVSLSRRCGWMTVGLVCLSPWWPIPVRLMVGTVH